MGNHLAALSLLCQAFAFLYDKDDTEVFTKEWWGKPFDGTSADFECSSVPDEARTLFRWIKGANEMSKAEFTDLVMRANTILKKIKG